MKNKIVITDLVLKRIEELEKIYVNDIKVLFIKEDIMIPIGWKEEYGTGYFSNVSSILKNRKNWFQKRIVNKFNNRRHYVYVGDNADKKKIWTIYDN